MTIQPEHTFADGKGRRIDFELDCDVHAYYKGQLIGSITVDEDRYSRTHLWSLDVDPEFQRAGIATEMMKLIAGVHGWDIGKPLPGDINKRKDDATSYYTSEGQAFIDHCIRSGILKPHPAADEDD